MAHQEDPTNEAAKGESRAIQCDLGQAQEVLGQTTKMLFEDFTNRRIDATMALAGLQLVQDALDACGRGDRDACQQLNLIQHFLKQVQKEDARR